MIYVRPVLALLKKTRINGIAHITGGGFYDNISRILPKGCAAVLNRHSWKVPKIFKVIQERTGLDDENMYRTFNMGVGMVIVLGRKYAEKAQAILSGFKLRSWIIGEIAKGKRKVII